MPSRPRSPATLVSCVLVAALAVAGRARADAKPIELRWDAPTSCPTSEAVEQASVRLLGGRTTDDRQVTAEGNVVQSAAGWRLSLRTVVDGVEGQRTLDATTCAELADATALILALAYDPTAVISEAGPAAQPKPAPPPRPPPTALPPPPPTAPAPTPEPPDPGEGGGERARASWFGGAVAVLASADAGALPSVAIGFGGALGLDLGPVRVELGGGYWLPQSQAVAPDGAGGDFDFASGYLQGCPGWRSGRWRLGGCGGLELGWMRAQGTGVVRLGEASALWAAVRFGAVGTVLIIEPLALRLDLGALVPLSRPVWVLDNVGVVDQPGPVTARVALGIEFVF